MGWPAADAPAQHGRPVLHAEPACEPQHAQVRPPGHAPEGLDRGERGHLVLHDDGTVMIWHVITDGEGKCMVAVREGRELLDWTPDTSMQADHIARFFLGASVVLHPTLSCSCHSDPRRRMYTTPNVKVH